MSTATVGEQPTSGRTRRELLERTLEEKEERRGQLVAEIAGLPLRIQEAADSALALAPTKSPFTVGSLGLKLRERLREAGRDLDNVEADIEARGRALRAAAVLEAEERLVELAAKIGPLDEAERDGWRKAGAALAALMVAREEVLVAAEAKDQLYLEATQAGLLNLDGDQEQWRRRFGPLARPFPADVGAFLETLLAVSCDVHGDGFRLPEGSRAADADRKLTALVPDLTRSCRTVELSGNVEKSYASRRLAEGTPPYWGAGAAA